ncbi:hypothetical protein [Nocardia sp. NPDC057353]|uniref:hypothetical protein n=1 Tax=Nocardia sp. NPDC057353 TaxID=3346104 RepID=UPI003642E895
MRRWARCPSTERAVSAASPSCAEPSAARNTRLRRGSPSSVGTVQCTAAQP